MTTLKRYYPTETGEMNETSVDVAPCGTYAKWDDAAREIERLEGELDKERWQHAACLTIAEGAAPGWDAETWAESEAIRAVRRLRQESLKLEARVKAITTTLEFASAAIQDAILLDDGLDGAAGEAVLKMIVEAVEHGTVDQVEPEEIRHAQEVEELTQERDTCPRRSAAGENQDD